MAAPTPAAKAITDLEQRIAKLHLALEKARTQELASAEKALLSAQKNAASAAKKLAELNGKTIRGPKSAAASAREKLLKKDAEGSAKALVAAQAAFDNLSSAYAEAAYIADEVAALLNSPAKKAAKAKAEKPAKAQKPGKVAKQAAKAQKAEAKKAEAKKIASKNIEPQQPDAQKRDKAAAKKAPKAEAKSGNDKTTLADTGSLNTAKARKATARKTQTAAKKKAAAQKAVAPLEDAGSAAAALGEIAAQSQETPAVPVSAPSAGDALVSNLASNTEAAIVHTTPEISEIKSSEIAPAASVSAADTPLPSGSATA